MLIITELYSAYAGEKPESAGPGQGEGKLKKQNPKS